MKCVTILGSTGSIGTQTLQVIRQYAEDFDIFSLVAGTNIDKMAEQVEEFRPRLVVMKDAEHADRLEESLEEQGVTSKPEILYGMDGYLAAVQAPEVDLVVAAMVGMIGLRPVLTAIEHGKDIAIANKETLVCAGHLIMKKAREHKVRLLPVDSEHSAIFQCLQDVPGGPFADGVPVERQDGGYAGAAGGRASADGPIETIFLTASGGPFRKATREELESVTVEQALAHPNWAMGAKITTDSATMINKGLEIIEATWLFDVPVDRIHVLVQPKSIIHSMVGFRDGAVLAQLGSPDMRVPIQYALLYPERRDLDDKRLDFEELASISFEKPNTEVLRGIPIAVESARIGGTMTTVMNAANEYAVDKFLQKRLPFLQIYGMIEYAMEQHTVIEEPTLENILEAEAWTYRILDERLRQ
ncbi:MAG: 1-deoxy-D-xylulose-5-phosphate reductoisomerase [Eubacterium sp.]|nr:1-deoxy-D-xylulose-5-phosphate reductoisomerase [Eubacterium sp.]